MFSYTFMPKLLNMSLTASVAIVLVILLRLLLKKAPKVISYALWGVVLFRLLCPVSIGSSFSLYNLFDVPTEASGTLTSVMEYVPSNIVHTEYPSVALPVPGISDAINEALPQGQEQLVADPLEAPMSFATYIWMAGVLVMVIYSIVSYVRLRSKLSVVVPLRDNIFIADDIKSPFVVGLFRPKIYLPCNLGEQEQTYIILHEQHHIKRLDHVAKALAFLALAIHWFNPLVWVAFILASKDMEMSCDEAVIRKVGVDVRADYSASLLTLATGRRIIAGTPLAFGEGDTKGRINNLSKWKKPAVWVVLIAVLACIVLAVGLLTNPSATHLNEIIGEDGYTILNQEKHEFELTISKSALPDSIYSEKGCDFEENEVIVYSTDTTKIYLMHAQLANEGNDRMYFEFNYSYEYPDSGQILLPYQVKEEGYFVNLMSKNISDSVAVYENAVALRGHGPGERFTLYIDTEVCQTASDYLVIPVFCNALTYTKGDGESEPVVGTSDKGFDFFDNAAELIQGTAYVSYQCIYMNPLSSYAAVGGDSGYRYIINENAFVIMNRNSGNIVSINSNPSVDTAESTPVSYEADVEKWEWQEFPYTDEEWEALYSPGGFGGMKNISEQFDEILYQPLEKNRFLLRVDGDLWLVELRSNDRMGTYLWSIYSLVPESAMGVAQWEYAPMLSSRSPYFRFEFDMDYTEITAACEDGLLVDWETSGKPSDHSMTFKKGEALCWSPQDEENSRVSRTTIHFTVLNGDESLYFGTLYIEGVGGDSDGRPIYTASLVGTGLHLEPNTEREGGVITAIAKANVFRVVEHDLTTGDLEVPTEDLGSYVFYTNSAQISVTVKGDDFEGQVNLLDVSQNNAHILQAKVNTREDDCLFTGLTSARLYRVDCEGLDGCAVVISGDK